MKTVKKYASLLLAMVLTIALATPAFASTTEDEANGKHTITITSSESGHEYTAYQVFTGTVSPTTDNQLSSVQWGDDVDGEKLLQALKDATFESTTTDPETGTTTTETKKYFENCTTAQDVADVLAETPFSDSTVITDNDKAYDSDKDDAALSAFARIVNDNLLKEDDTGTKSTENTTGEYTISGLADGYYLIKDTGTIATDSSATEYMLKVVESIEIKPKTDTPELDKSILGTEYVCGNTDSDHTHTLACLARVDSNNGAIGDVVTFELKSHVPNMDSYKSYAFIINDTLSKGLTLAGGLTCTETGTDHTHTGSCYDQTATNTVFTVTIGDKTLTAGTLQKSTSNGETVYDVTGEGAGYAVQITENPDGTTTIAIVFADFIQYRENQGDEIIVQYKAIINESALIGTDGNPNTAYLNYTNNPSDVGDGDLNDWPEPDKVKGETPKSKTITYVTALDLFKYTGEGDDKQALANATFEITGEKLNTVIITSEDFTKVEEGETIPAGTDVYYKLNDGSYTTTAPTDNTKDQYESITDKYTMEVKSTTTVKSEDVTYQATTDSDGYVRFSGLAAGNYIIEEIKAPNGYNLLTEPLYVMIVWNAPGTGEDTCTWTAYDVSKVSGLTKDTDGNVTEWPTDVTKDTENVEVLNQTTHTIEDEPTATVGVMTLEVKNNSGAVLPETGGIGTKIFYTVGTILALGAVILLVTKKRMSGR